ncbi:putative head to tail connecting protein [Erwinia phage pEp_SNUABM_10]|uniref:Portal protein n=1 Tax=Erwinia phage pEp_SNUABM_09 TaxID=2601644 RepID=A0A5J6DA79_9CAUD|nr:putative head to tail connecting protein [Erwinia phage pEp_SNUABM_09]QOC57620.1 putative head to tail connecting protein [Erwinia phage pEp_SNUABM_03]QOC57675.1 putative head to tail connecting protein [Erwinia phage pEp_SNUABM_04]QOC57725.1 putative head to tail connecting protein [Erwinia phage pEp_SNUABM_10]QOC57778.1 putative head to tail connecting protein [Erwinia phage pEp_SNUABM_11]
MAVTKREGFAEEGAKAVYERLKNDRQPYETRAENCAQFTIPSLFPKDSDNESTDYTTPWQAVGARGLNNLASKLMLALFPMQTWMKLTISEFEAKQLVGDSEGLAKVDEGLSMVERIIMNYIESNSYRVTLFECLKQLVVAGNCLLYLPDPKEGDNKYNPMRLYRLTSYVVQRDAYGNILQGVTRDQIAFGALPEDVRKQVESSGGEKKPDEVVDIYTHFYLDEESGEYLKYEEVEEQEIDGTDAQYPLDALPYIPVRMVRIDGESYGRSYAEEYLGDLRSLENLQEAIVKMSMISSKVIGLVNPAGITQVRRLTKAQTGDFVPGVRADIDFLQLEKAADFSVAKAVSDQIESRLSYAFMLNSAVQRTGERVTAEEIRYVASELEDTLGGVYSILSQELQLPLVRILLKQLQATQQIPELPKEAVEPTISTGLEAIGRGQDLDKLERCLAAWAQVATLGQDPDINLATIKLRIANAIGIDTSGILLTEEEKQRRMAMQSAQVGMDSAAGQAGAGMGNLATQSPEALEAAAGSMGMQPGM